MRVPSQSTRTIWRQSPSNARTISMAAIVRVCLLIAVACGGCAVAEPKWQSYTPMRGMITVDIPGHPEITHESMDVGYGSAAVERASCEVAGGEKFEVMVASLPAGRSPLREDEILDRFVEGFAVAVNAKAKPGKAIRLAGYPGVESEAEVSGKGRATFRCILVQGRVYLFFALGQPESRFDEHRARFLGSIALTK